jgi:hypothetical protein
MHGEFLVRVIEALRRTDQLTDPYARRPPGRGAPRRHPGERARERVTRQSAGSALPIRDPS